jgi:hypothetical protein
MTTRKPYLDVRRAPSAREIKRICKQIRAGWSPAERISRVVKGLQMCLTPLLSVAERVKLPNKSGRV